MLSAARARVASVAETIAAGEGEPADTESDEDEGEDGQIYSVDFSLRESYRHGVDSTNYIRSKRVNYRMMCQRALCRPRCVIGAKSCAIGEREYQKGEEKKKSLVRKTRKTGRRRASRRRLGAFAPS